MKDDEIMGAAEARIAGHRTAEAGLRLVDAGGAPLAGFEGRVRLVRHEFKLGCNAFRVGNIEDPGLQREYEGRFADLLNYATLPFYWGGYEREMGSPGAERLCGMAGWCAANGVATKGHPLVWHEVFPKWAEGLDDGEVLRRLEARVRGTVAEFAGLVDIWDVVNEATVSARFENAVGRWVKAEGPAAVVARALSWAHEASAEAELLYNDFNVSPDFESLVQDLVDAGAPVRAGACEAYSQWGLPVHFTEATVLSGRPKAEGDDDWHRVRDDWPTTPEGEAAQREYGRMFYTTLFSHPAVEAVTWWDFSDLGAWQGAPAGLVRRDMSPKPLYDWLLGRFGPGGEWSTDEQVSCDAEGRAGLRCFFGEYEVTGRTPSGDEVRGRFTVEREGPREHEVALG